MEFVVLKSMTWAGRDLKPGDKVEIPDESSKIGPLARAKFIRYGTDAPPGPLPKVKEVAEEIKAEEQSAVVATVAVTEKAVSRDPKDIVRQAKAKASRK